MSAALYCFDLGSPYFALDGHEVLVSETVVEMHRRGNWMVPMLNNVPRLNKPPMQYWLVGLVSVLTGGVDELSSRLPSALFGIALVLITYLFGRRIFDDGVAFLAGAVQAGNIFMIKFARQGTTDMGNVFFVFTSFVCAWYVLEDRKNMRLWQAGLWLSIAMDTLVKGPFGAVTTLASITFYLIYFKRYRELKDIFCWWSILLFLALSIPWYLYLGLALKGTWHIWYEQTFLRVEGGLLSKAPWYFYFPVIAAFLAQWTLILPLAIARVFSKSESGRRKILFYLFFWFAVEFVMISISSAKRDRYLSWGLTPMAYLIALELMALGARLKSSRRASHITGISGVILAVVFSAAGILLNRKFEWVPANLLYLFPLTGAVWVIIFALVFKRRPGWALAAFFIAEVFLFQAGTRLLYARFNDDLPVAAFSREVSRKVPENKRIFMINEAKPAIVFYSDRYLLPVATVEEAMKLENGSFPLYIISGDYIAFSKQYPQLKILISSAAPDFEKNKESKKRFGLFRMDAPD